MIAKLAAAHGFKTEVLRYNESDLMNRKRKVRVKKNFSEWKRISRVLQDSILGPLQSKIF